MHFGYLYMFNPYDICDQPAVHHVLKSPYICRVTSLKR
jgi:hypothetical protein